MQPHAQRPAPPAAAPPGGRPSVVPVSSRPPPGAPPPPQRAHPHAALLAQTERAIEHLQMQADNARVQGVMEAAAQWDNYLTHVQQLQTHVQQLQAQMSSGDAAASRSTPALMVSGLAMKASRATAWAKT